MTKLITINRAKASKSKPYRDSWIGIHAFFTTHDGDEILGTITHWDRWYPVVTFNDGTWGRLDETFRIYK